MTQRTKKFILTHEGLVSLKREYNELIDIKRPAVTQRIQRAREFGDLSENSEYDAAKDEQTLLESRISQLEEVLRKAQIIEPAQKTDFVIIGSTVVVEVDGEVDEFTIVGTMEADPAKRKISNESPVGAALLGTKVGEVIEVATTIVRAKYKILEIK
ncbi:transcription elongation factor GreA [Candidatus Curtissbacteria bacterium RIFCSPHIGHO2_01_FULL_41_44]|uniref:Transcription elongation factor GreA n=1 Tax=Candidatus Curtissbacteria bacterium RIFCSPLOWO2_01_FULL_42_50 TaxID=1797730 RepID=A0A1F5H3N0_9BACT|nr:MAG: transcription elongation factor GreA [Candidatus Curtissbacteria bacterium RIFCSPHIGHO2_01_FULL_41_44]OGD94461.1 MAG: transcription elongation factor GreA [Candidatus Curtissbacteria bacterium RIFCSPHIGHO2_02_FULL_42_58]OGD97536.1 MAG: transcription elongation factor GreA [Candidatus Curtissbacteria bacterium RIFCSPHIGHO2_12_FULL_42_33]OGD98766.1 MAG: transcription elongation factor GreA [Candidatus Curtissbacteria bacterium RIFCSPLOWO2_01_FULL_42_50]OGE03823.1 MAG: transcription elonga